MADESMIKDDKNSAEQPTENNILESAVQAGVAPPTCVKTHASTLAIKVGIIEKKCIDVSAKWQKKTKTITSSALDVAKHPSHYAEFGASLAEGLAGESLGEIVGGSIGTVFGPVGTVIGAEVGGLAGEVFGARQGCQIAKKFLHQSGTEHPLKEDVQKESTAKAGAEAGKVIGGMIGDALFDDVGSEFGEKIGKKLGGLVGNITFEHIEHMHIKPKNKPD